MTAPARFGRLARAYRWMEYFSFGPYLQQCRTLRMDEAASHRRALVYGDGNGRFLAELIRRAPAIQATAVDASAVMLRQAARKLPDGSHVRFVHADALACEPAQFPEAPFDLVVSHFFLDCFTEPEVELLLSRVQNALCDDAIWIVSDFAIPERAPAKQIAALIVRGLYVAFGLLTGLTTRRLPDHGRMMQNAGWRLEDRQELLFGLLISERWRRGFSEGNVRK
jgi:ubiquinone/menaquinone biosynthesis C-methylase UbiE